MTDQELRKLKRDELLQIMIAQSKRIAVLKKRLDAAERKLASRELALKETGNIAEASLKLNKIFEDAQAAADQYLYNVKRMAQKELHRQGLQGLVRGKHAAPMEDEQSITAQATGHADTDSETEEIAGILEETMAEAAETEAEYEESVKGDEVSYENDSENVSEDGEEYTEEDVDEADDQDAEEADEADDPEEEETDDPDDADESDEEVEDEADESDADEDDADEADTDADSPEDISGNATAGRRASFGNRDKDSYLL